MSNNINRIRKNKLKGTGIFAAAALTAALIAGNNIPGVTRQVSAAESQENTVSSLIPDNITLDKPVELADVELPATEYGTFEWADGSFVPAQRVQSCEVLLIPAEGQDLSHVDGWDPESGAVVGYINVIVNSITDGDNVDKTEGSGKTDPTENADPTETPETSSEKPAADENADTDNKEDKESKSDQDNKTDTDNEENKIEEDKTDNKNNKDNNSNADKTDKDTETTGKLEPADDMTQDKEDTKKDDEDGADDNIFDNPVLPNDKDDRPTDAEDSLSDEEKEERAALNHTCDGITVSGVNLPWYVQFRVSSGDSYQFTNESDAMIFQSYEFELWDLKNNTEYEIPNGDYISVTVPVKSGYQYTIEHLLDNGATETIIPSVENGIMVFSTHSFSPFGIAGSRQLVGPDAGNDTDDTDAVTPAPASSDSQSSDSGKNNTVSMNNSSDSNNGSSSDQNDNSTENKAVKNNNTVNTGDTTSIMPFVILFVAAAVIAGVAVFIKKEKEIKRITLIPPPYSLTGGEAMKVRAILKSLLFAYALTGSGITAFGPGTVCF